MRPSVGSKEFVLIAEAFTQVGGQTMVDRAAVRVVGVHIAEGNAAGIGKSVHCRRIASGVEAGKRFDESCCLCNARGGAAQIVSSRDGWVEPAGPKEIHQRRVHVRKWT